MSKKIEIFKAFIVSDGEVSVTEIARKFKVTRQGVYEAVEAVRKGSEHKLKVCEVDFKMECIWQTKYYPRWQALTTLVHSEAVIAELRWLYHDMKKDGFSTAAIAKKTGKDHQTIRHHLSRPIEKTNKKKCKVKGGDK